MADITQEIEAFLNAKYGEHVRSAMVSAMNKINTVNEDGVAVIESQVQIDEEPTEYTKLKLETTGSTINVVTKEEFEEYIGDSEAVKEAVTDWLDEHPEATTTVQDGSLGVVKLTNEAKLYTVKDYVTPEMYGAVGDGETDDTQAFIDALTENDFLYVPINKYVISTVELTHGKHIYGEGTIIVTGSGFLFNCPRENKSIDGITFEIDNEQNNCIVTEGDSDDLFHNTLTISNVSFNGIDESEIIAVEIGADNDAKVLNCNFNGCGIRIKNSINPVISECVFQGGYYGIVNENTDNRSGRDAYACGLRIQNTTVLGCVIGIKTVQVDSIHIVNCMVDYDDYPVIIIGTNNPILEDSYFSSRGGNIAIYIARNNSNSGVFGGNGLNSEYTRDVKISNCVALIHSENLNNECISLHNVQYASIRGLTVEYAGKAGICIYDSSNIHVSDCSIRSTLSGAYAINSYVSGVQNDDSSYRYSSIKSDLPVYVANAYCPMRIGYRDAEFTTTEQLTANTWYVIKNISDINSNIGYDDVISITFTGGNYAYGSVSFLYAPSSGNIRVCGTQTLPVGTLIKFRVAYKVSRPNYN